MSKKENNQNQVDPDYAKQWQEWYKQVAENIKKKHPNILESTSDPSEYKKKITNAIKKEIKLYIQHYEDIEYYKEEDLINGISFYLLSPVRERDRNLAVQIEKKANHTDEKKQKMQLSVRPTSVQQSAKPVKKLAELWASLTQGKAVHKGVAEPSYEEKMQDLAERTADQMLVENPNITEDIIMRDIPLMVIQSDISNNQKDKQEIIKYLKKNVPDIVKQKQDSRAKSKDKKRVSEKVLKNAVKLIRNVTNFEEKSYQNQEESRSSSVLVKTKTSSSIG